MNEIIDVFPWNKSFETGIAKIDEQHQKLVLLINKLANHLGCNSNHALLNKTFAELAEYTEYHFCFEETIWAEYFPNHSLLKGHLNVHASFISKLLELKEEGESKPLNKVVEDLLLFLTRWLANHILDSDMRMSKIVLAMQSGMSLEMAQQHARKEMSGIMTIMYDLLCQRTITLIHQISTRRKIEEKLELSSRIFKNTHDGIFIIGANKLIIDVNPAFCEITGYSCEDVIGKNQNILSSGKQSTEFYQAMWQQLNAQGHWQGEVWNRRKNGNIYAELLTISTLKDEGDIITHYVGIFSDITASKQQQEQLSLMAHYDVLTSLPNRSLFVDRFNRAIAHSKRTKKQLAICFLDIDNFKPVNDNHGHETGDKLLIEVAKRILANLREEDTVSRQGGDEFALLLNDVESFSQCEQTLSRIHHALAQPYIIDDYPHKITISSGITLYPADKGDIDTLLRHADQAMYQAKLEGKHRYHLFNPDSDQRMIEKHHQLDEIEHALENNQFQLYYQPKVNMVTGKVFGTEALIRWLHPEKGLIPPLGFLPIIEGTGLEIKIGNWVVNQALEQLKVWNKLNIKLEVSINISSHYLSSTYFFEQLDTALSAYPTVDSKCLQLEILESSALGDLKAISDIIKACQSDLGVSIALDDFGTGYSSLTHLRSLTVNTIKIDQSFVRDMLDEPNDYTIIDGIIGLTNSFNRNVIAEGVETTAHGLMLLVMGCEQAQGYGIAKPMPADDFPQWLREYTPNKEWLFCGNKHRNEKAKKVRLFNLVSEQWKNKFIANIQSSPENIKHWPIMNNKHCHCGVWLQRAKKEQLFEQQVLNRLEQAHKKMHVIANGLRLKYQQSDIDSARGSLAELQIVFDKINYELGTCK